MSFNFSEWALRHKSFILFFIILTTLAGIYSYGALGRKEDPDFTIKTMIVGAVWSGAGTVEMADQVTDKLELALQAIPEIDYTKSSTRAGSTTVIVQLRSDTNAAEFQQRFGGIGAPAYQAKLAEIESRLDRMPLLAVR